MLAHHSFSVKARPDGYWNNTGVSIKSSDHVTVEYISGSWRCNPHWGPTNGAGDGRYIAQVGGGGMLLPGVPEGSLIGKVGGDNSGGGSKVFHIGNLGSVPVGLEGVLWLTVNDDHPGFGDNKGDITVQITIGEKR